MESKSEYTVVFYLSSRPINKKIYKLLINFFSIKLYQRINMFKRLKKHGQIFTNYQKHLKIKFTNIGIQFDINFIKIFRKKTSNQHLRRLT